MFFEYKDRFYPEYIKQGPGSRFIEAFAKEYCKGNGVNIGYGSDAGKIFPSETCRFLDIKDGYNCNCLDDIDENSLDYVFSSHSLEHMNDWHQSLENWISKIKVGGCIFLYLPHYSMEYWRPENNKKHKSIIFQEDVENVLRRLCFSHIFSSGADLYYSYCVVGIK